MTNESKTPKLEQKQILKREQRISKDIIPSYIGKEIVFEVSDVGNPVCSGYLQKYDKRFLQIKDFKQHEASLENMLNRRESFLERNPTYDITKPESIRYALPKREIAVCLVASIQSLENVLNVRRLK